MHRLIENTSQLRPCPFCGVRRVTVEVRDGGPLLYGRSSIVGRCTCVGCGASIEGRALSIESAVVLVENKWNMRQPEEQHKVTHMQGRART